MEMNNEIGASEIPQEASSQGAIPEIPADFSYDPELDKLQKELAAQREAAKEEAAQPLPTALQAPDLAPAAPVAVDPIAGAPIAAAGETAPSQASDSSGGATSNTPLMIAVVIAVALVVTIIGSNMIRKPAPSNQAPTPAQVR